MREAQVPMQVTYDKKHGYVCLASGDYAEASAHQVRLDETCGYEGHNLIVLDLDERWRLIGIELLDANRSLPASILNQVKRT